MNDNELIEKLAELEHKQWLEWSRSIDKQLYTPRNGLPIAYEDDIAHNFLEKKESWLKNYWKDYSELTEEAKEMDRVWARKVLKIIKSASNGS